MSTMTRRLAWVALAMAVGALGACAADEGYYDEAGAGAPDDGAAGGAGGGAVECVADSECGAGYVCWDSQCLYQGEDLGGADGEPVGGQGPAEEVDLSDPGFSLPSAAGGQVWISSPAQDTAVHIDATTLEIGVIEVGRRPTRVLALPGGAGAVVLNEGSEELSIIRLVEGEPDITHLPLGGRFNRLELSPDGQHALCWFKVDPALPEAPPTLQSVLVVELDAMISHPVAIGFKPSEVHFDEAGHALVVTEDGLSVFPLSPDAEPEAPQVARTLPLAPSSRAVGQREVHLTPDRTKALSLGAGEPGVTLLSIETGEVQWLELGEIPTDLDVDPKGRWAMVTLGTVGQIVRVDLEEGGAPDLEGEAGGPTLDWFEAGGAFDAMAMSPNGRYAVLYETSASTPELGVMDIASGGVVVRRLRKRVVAVTVAPGGDVAYIQHQAEPIAIPTGRPLTEEEIIAQSHGWSLLSLSTLYAKLHTTPAPPMGPVFDAGGLRVLVMLSDPAAGVRRLQVAGLQAFELVDTLLGSAPEAAGVIEEAGRAFVTQAEPAGRISFIDFETGRVSTVGGYALNSRIR